MMFMVNFILRQVKSMPLNDFEKFRKYAPKLDTEHIGVENTISRLVDNAEKFKLKKIQLTLLADDFFKDNKGLVSASIMSKESLVPPHNHDYYEINYVISGQCVEYIGDRAFVLNEGDFLLMPPSVFHTSESVDNSICANILLKSKLVSDLEKKLIAYDLDNYLTRMQKQKSYMVFNAKQTRAFKTANHLLEHFGNKQTHTKHKNLYAESLAFTLLLELAECDFDEIAFSNKKQFPTTDVSGAILQYIRDNISSATLESVSSYFGYSPAHLSRIIKKHTGNGFATFIMLQRMLRAEQLLLQTDTPVGKIPELIGLDSKEYFSRVFKRYNNVTPSEYRKAYSKR